jgi:hypothetical protein
MPHQDPGADGEDRPVTQDQPDPEAGYEGQEHVLLQADIGPQEMNAMLEIIFEINNLRGSCGHRSERKETPTRGAPYTLVTVFFPEASWLTQNNWTGSSRASTAPSTSKVPTSGISGCRFTADAIVIGCVTAMKIRLRTLLHSRRSQADAVGSYAKSMKGVTCDTSAS